MAVDRGIQDAQRDHKTKTTLGEMRGKLCHYGVLMEDGPDEQDSILDSVKFVSIRSRVSPALKKKNQSGRNVQLATHLHVLPNLFSYRP